MLKIRRPLGRLIFNMGIAIPGKTVFLIETAPRTQFPRGLYEAIPKYDATNTSDTQPQKTWHRWVMLIPPISWLHWCAFQMYVTDHLNCNESVAHMQFHILAEDKEGNWENELHLGHHLDYTQQIFVDFCSCFTTFVQRLWVILYYHAKGKVVCLKQICYFTCRILQVTVKNWNIMHSCYNIDQIRNLAAYLFIYTIFWDDIFISWCRSSSCYVL